ncbi:MAG TPA: protein phosphatase 2C domain-containing protein [Myxococcota bacterium]|nr:protein phosphatase 2C domain-containing protein [Myxococcota bacterium]
MKATLLRGRDHTVMGAVAGADDGPVALALSRGGAPKPYPHTEPNEDAALCARGENGLLVAVADGHWGHRAAELALGHLLAEVANEWTEGKARGAASWRQAALAALAGANGAVLSARTPEQRSRTTLALALARPLENLLVCGSMGDSHLFRVGDDGVLELAVMRGSRAVFLGERLSPAALAREARVEVQSLEPCVALVAATDGLSEESIGVADPAAAVREAVALARGRETGTRAAAAAHALVEAALAAHRKNQAGDNIAAAVAWLRREG